jgi:hypothetical protein
LICDTVVANERHVRYVAPPAVSNVVSYWLALRVAFFPPVPVYYTRMHPVSFSWITLPSFLKIIAGSFKT